MWRKAWTQVIGHLNACLRMREQNCGYWCLLVEVLPTASVVWAYKVDMQQIMHVCLLTEEINEFANVTDAWICEKQKNQWLQDSVWEVFNSKRNWFVACCKDYEESWLIFFCLFVFWFLYLFFFCFFKDWLKDVSYSLWLFKMHSNVYPQWSLHGREWSLTRILICQVFWSRVKEIICKKHFTGIFFF